MLTKDSKMWEILVEAKKYLGKTISSKGRSEKGKTAYICYSINQVLSQAGIHGTTKSYLRLIELIHARLEGCSALSTWLVHKGYCKSLEECYEFKGSKLQATRHAWVDSMIQEFKAKGI